MGNIYITPELTKSEHETVCRIQKELGTGEAAGKPNLIIHKHKVVSSTGGNADGIREFCGNINSLFAMGETHFAAHMEPILNSSDGQPGQQQGKKKQKKSVSRPNLMPDSLPLRNPQG